MKKITLILLSVFSSFLSFSQRSNMTKRNWMDTAAYGEFASPSFKVFGPLSEALAELNDGKEYLFVNKMYFEVKSVADYYLWYTQYNHEKFNYPVSEYFEYYVKKDIKAMMVFVQEGFNGEELPIDFKKINFSYPSHLVNIQKFSKTSKWYNGLRVDQAGELNLDFQGRWYRFQAMNRPPVVPSSK